MIDAPKYSQLEIERRWLVDLSAVALEHTPFREIDDLYIAESARKRRYSLPSGSLDVYFEPNADLAVFEMNFDDEGSASEFEPPHFVTREITNESAFTGASLAECRVTA
jgi:CYTH domain-containing protein